MKEPILKCPGNPEPLLREEIEFWKDYINYCLSHNSKSVPQRAYAALKLAEVKLSLVLTTEDDQDGFDQPAH